MTGIVFILLIIAYILKKFEKENTSQIMKKCLYIGIAYWLSLPLITMMIGVEGLKDSSTMFFVVEMILKTFTGFLFYQALKTLSKGENGRGFVLAMIILTALDVVINLATNLFI